MNKYPQKFHFWKPKRLGEITFEKKDKVIIDEK